MTNNKDDYVIFEVTLKNNSSDKYKIKKISDNNSKEYISTTYTYPDEYINSGETISIDIKLSYDKELLNQDELDLDDLTIKLDLVNEKGSSSSATINPKTNDGIIKYIILLGVSILAIILIVVVKNKGIKVIAIGFVLLSITLIPIIANADEKIELNIRFTNLVVKGRYDSYLVIFDKNSDDATGLMPNQVIKLGNVTKLNKNTFQRYAYGFVGWTVNKDGSGNFYANEAEVLNLVSEDVHEITLYAQWEKVMAVNVSYDNSKTGVNCSDAQCMIDYLYSQIE